MFRSVERIYLTRAGILSWEGIDDSGLSPDDRALERGATASFRFISERTQFSAAPLATIKKFEGRYSPSI
jgi:hypothetical protein